MNTEETKNILDWNKLLIIINVSYKEMKPRREVSAMKTKEELNALKSEVETVNEKLAELTEDELAQVSGGDWGVQEYETFLSKSENGGGESSVVGFHPGYVEFP